MVLKQTLTADTVYFAQDVVLSGYICCNSIKFWWDSEANWINHWLAYNHHIANSIFDITAHWSCSFMTVHVIWTTFMYTYTQLSSGAFTKGV